MALTILQVAQEMEHLLQTLNNTLTPLDELLSAQPLPEGLVVELHQKCCPPMEIWSFVQVVPEGDISPRLTITLEESLVIGGRRVVRVSVEGLVGRREYAVPSLTLKHPRFLNQPLTEYHKGFESFYEWIGRAKQFCNSYNWVDGVDSAAVAYFQAWLVEKVSEYRLPVPLQFLAATLNCLYNIADSIGEVVVETSLGAIKVRGDKSLVFIAPLTFWDVGGGVSVERQAWGLLSVLGRRLCMYRFSQDRVPYKPVLLEFLNSAWALLMQDRPNEGG